MNYHNITKDDLVNGEGVRVVLWVAGCSHKCFNCQNPETWDEKSGIPFDQSAEDELFEELDKDYVSGITFSGGDPLFPNNRETITNLCKKIRERYGNSKTIWSYTGFLYENVKDLEIMKYLDVLCDGPFIQKLKKPDIHWVGSLNQRVIDIPKTRKCGEIILWKK